MRLRMWLAMAVAGLFVPAARAELGQEPDAAAVEFFESRIRPVLVNHCVECHGPEEQKAGLRLDSAEAVRVGSESGPVVTTGDPEESPLIWAIRYDDILLQMPPKGKLSDAAIADLETWVRLGAPWSEGEELAPLAMTDQAAAIAEARASHWAFRPVVEPPIPQVQDRTWPVSPLDHFILARLEEQSLEPSPPADRRTLIRRATFDLTGLPPTIEEVEAFERDPSPDAFETVVDRLLVSPHYGERWGRHWLDVARYADTKGYVYGDREELRFPFSYTYRDYVIRSFNEDKPYDRFLREQVAADLMIDPETEDKSALAALGYLTLGRRFLGNAHDIIDDRLDVIFRGMQALTVTCARCHDHKYDPIPIDDYYSLYGVLAGTTETTVRLINEPERTEAFFEYENELRNREQALAAALDAKRAELSDRLRDRVAEYLAAVLDAELLPGDEHYQILSADDLNPVIARRWQSYLLKTRAPFHPIFGPWHAFAALTADQFAAEAPALARTFAENRDPDQPLNTLVAEMFVGPPPSSMAEVAGRYGTLLYKAHRRWKETVSQLESCDANPPTELAEPDLEAVRQVLYATDAPTMVPPVHINQLEFLFEEKTRVELGRLQKQIDAWHLESPATPPHALILTDTPTQRNPRVFLRGNPKSTGDEVPRQFLQVLHGLDRIPFANGSGRLELAEAIADPENPLTARVLVNRVWMHHFGEGLVRTPSDFGARSEPPSHPDLLDWLAARFHDEGWSIKALHRWIMLSRTYQQSSADHPQARAQDPDNRLLARMDRRRLEWESLRDAMLATAGRLDPEMGGRPVRLTTTPFETRRTVYGYIDRQDLPGVFRVFDLASPDQHTPQRHTTTVPQQALFLMNSPFVVEQARALAERVEVASDSSPEARIHHLYRFIFQREPSATEIDIGLQFLSEPPHEPPPPPEPPPTVWVYGRGHLDEAQQRVTAFEPFSHWTGDTWQSEPGDSSEPHSIPKLTRDGGQPGPGVEQAAIRRWVSPVKGVVAISGQLRHDAEQGDGVLGAIVSSRSGELGRWVVHQGEAEAKVDRIEVEPGETIDFVVTGRDDPEADTFAWAPEVRLIEPRPIDGPRQWNARDDFQGPPPEPPPPLTPWEALTQALLLSNEFVFID